MPNTPIVEHGPLDVVAQTGSLMLCYLKRPSTQIILVCFVALSLLFVTVPSIDLYVSGLFYENGFYMAGQPWSKFLSATVNWFIFSAIAISGAIYVFNYRSGQQVLGIDGRKLTYLFLVLLLGPGLIVNAVLKEEFGRARPRHIQEFGGQAQFTPAFVISSNCKTNCSFSCGDGAAAFYSLAFFYALSRKRKVLAAAVSYGILVSAARVTAGGHFLSDAVVSFFIMLILSDALYYFMFLDNRLRPKAPQPESVS